MLTLRASTSIAGKQDFSIPLISRARATWTCGSKVKSSSRSSFDGALSTDGALSSASFMTGDSLQRPSLGKDVILPVDQDASSATGNCGDLLSSSCARRKWRFSNNKVGLLAYVILHSNNKAGLPVQKGIELSGILVEIKSGEWALKVVPWQNERMRQIIKIEPWTFVQKLGDVVFLPIGCAHQVRNLKIMGFISKPGVFKSPNSETYVIFGEAKIEDLSSQLQTEAAQQFKMSNMGNLKCPTWMQ
ncbi:hypothetical protein L1987_01084 [Smallanthus sonchifolius]|uniref:Uncharacterized protein n=1 Tax=Smallanthus sonchifolius TaxID=185202 RepID=A0ACB9K420_9ASTR|nr:hypothetical protein L1987_01084 [Smallanthus sonchifolius]